MRARGVLLPWLVFLFCMTTPAPAQSPPLPANPLLQEWSTPFGVPPFDAIEPAHFLPAFTEAVARQRREVETIASSPEPPTFANTVEALEFSGGLLEKVSPVFSNLSSADTNEQLQAINREVTPMLAALRDDIRLNAALFRRIGALWARRETLGLAPDQWRLLEETYKRFVRGGANLGPQDQARLRAVNRELAVLGVAFGDNLLHDTNAVRLVIERREDLAGLPPAVVTAAADSAVRAGRPGAWLFTLQSPSIWPFLTYAENRELRRRLFMAYVTRNDHGDAYDNKAVLARIAVLRAERAALLGYESHAAFVLEDSMAKTPGQVTSLLRRLWTPALAMARQEASTLQDAIRREGGAFTLEPWDWRFYARKVKQERFTLDDQALRPYFPLERVRDGAFLVAKRLYGLSIEPRPDVPVYHPEVNAFEVKDADGSHLGVFYTDYHPRPGKRVGAWSSRYRAASSQDGRIVRPIVVNVCNFSRPTGNAPALLGLEEVRTLFHEFGHALHSLLTRVPYPGIATVPRDFVELPSQIMENWALAPEVLRGYATHYQTGEAIPLALIEKIEEAERFNQGFATVEYLSAAILDMDWHTVKPGPPADAVSFERASLARIDMPPQIVVRYRSPYFNHIFGPGGGYAAGYYSYIWSEVLDADAFQLFEERGLFDPESARSFRTSILERGHAEDAAVLYRRFRGRDPDVEPLLVRRGLK